ncbi:MAG: hypothetical protein KIH69_023330 [Anaerolineae bacterium]|nr:hypothetical protein [Anaerolineae bacterium]
MIYVLSAVGSAICSAVRSAVILTAPVTHLTRHIMAHMQRCEFVIHERARGRQDDGATDGATG